MALKQSLQHRLLQKLSPQQIQLMKLLQVPTVELEQRIKQEIVDNPALEEGAEEKDELQTFFEKHNFAKEFSKSWTVYVEKERFASG